MLRRGRNESDIAARRTLLWAALWLAVLLVAVKAYYLGSPEYTAADDYLRSLAAISYLDVLFAGVVWAGARSIVGVARRPATLRAVAIAFLVLSALSCAYALADVVVFGVLGGFLTYPLVPLIWHVRMLGSAVTASLTAGEVAAVVALPIVHIALVRTAIGLVPSERPLPGFRRGLPLLVTALWVVGGQQAYARTWATRQEHRIAENPQWVFVSSWWRTLRRHGMVSMPGEVLASDLADFDPLGQRASAPPPAHRRETVSQGGTAESRRRPPNVVVIVLEAVAARWTSVNGSYDTTPNLKAEAARALVFDSFYAHIGRSSNELTAMLMSRYPKLGFRDITDEYPRLAGTSLATLFRDRGYRTAFITSSDLNWAGWGTFFEGRGFDLIRDYRGLTCSPPLSEWGVEERCLVDAILQFIDRDPAGPFFVMAWTEQTHYPYEPTPGVPLLDLGREPSPDGWDLGRYLNVLHDTDRHLERLFDALRRAELDDDTLVVVAGDHGQAFGYPHDSYGQGRTAYEEDVHVPLMVWLPPRFPSAARSAVIGSHVDLPPTIAELAGLSPSPDWQGRSLFDPAHPARAYFYVAEDRFILGVREGDWKYLVDLREGTDELFDLSRDPNEQRNLAPSEPARCARLRQRLAAWMEANRRQYQVTN